MSGEPNTDGLLELLGEELVRQILAATSREPLSVKELSEQCDVARSTIYRRVEDMVAADLLVERTRLETDGSHHSVYAANVDRLTVDIDDGSISVSVAVREGASQRFSNIWKGIRET
ncbi:ArsR/SmtB family transcription factor [Halorientalis halophila]|uniref:ArsR/SmtB family transcription factor n=1 Tax=Halorientalis halophila TaxID=3108499 RepID=UPI00300942AE